MQHMILELKGQLNQQKCITEQFCADLVNLLLRMQVECRKIQNNAALGHLLPVRQCYKKIVPLLSDLIEKNRCKRCNSIRVREQIQTTIMSMTSYQQFIGQLLCDLNSHFDDDKERNEECRGIIQRQIINLQMVKESIVWISLYCRKSLKFIQSQQFLALLDQQSGTKQWNRQLYDSRQERDRQVRNWKDPDTRAAVKAEDCPTFNHLPIIISHIDAVESYYKQAPQPLTVKSRQLIIDHVQKVAARLQTISNGTKCNKCRNYSFERNRNLMFQSISDLLTALYQGQQQQIGIPGRLCVQLVKDSSCLTEQCNEKQLTQEVYAPPVEKLQMELVSTQQCATLELGTLLLGRFQSLLEVCSKTVPAVTGHELRSLLDQELKSHLPLFNQYVASPKCQQCHSDRSRVERELLSSNIDRCLSREYPQIVVEGSWFKKQIWQIIAFIAQNMARVVRWCQQQN